MPLILPWCGTASCSQHQRACGGYLWVAWFVTIWGEKSTNLWRTHCVLSVIIFAMLAQGASQSLSCRFVLCRGAVPGCLKGLPLFLLFQNRMLSSSEMLTCWVRFAIKLQAVFAQGILSSSSVVLLMVRFLFLSGLRDPSSLKKFGTHMPLNTQRG